MTNVVPFDRHVRLDEEARQRIVDALDESLLVEAAAGTGKTTVLVSRLVAMLATGRARVDSVAAVTFTRKAAGELKLRLRQELDRRRSASGDPDERQRLEQAIALLEEARVGTIHSFCADILRERPVEAGVDPGFVEVADGEAPRLYRRAFDRFIQERLDDLSPALRRALSRLAHDGSGAFDGSALDRLYDAGWNLVEWRDFPAPWRLEEIDREAAIDRLCEQVRRLAQLARAGRSADPLVRALAPVVLLDTWVERSEAVTGMRDYDGLEARLVSLRRELNRQGWNKGRGTFAEAVPREQVLEARERLIERLQQFENEANAHLAALLHGELRESIERYEELKRQAGRLDFHDLLLRTRDLLRDQPEVRRYLQRRFTHLFVDEFQDTDPLQAEILLLLAADDPEQSDWTRVRPVPGKLFLVGDPKQSIYRFRRADVRLYEEVKERLRQAGVATLYLSRSFRSVPSIQRFVNVAFETEMDGDRDAGNPEYVPLRPGLRRESPDQPSLVVLPVARPYGRYRVSQKSIDECLPEATASFVAWLLHDSGWAVEDPEAGGERVPIAPRHVCILFRRFVSWRQDVTRPYTSALEAHGIPHLLIGSRSFYRREEVETLRAALRAVEWPDDELSVWATLRGSLFAFTDEELWLYRQAQGRLHPFRHGQAELAGGPAVAGIDASLELLAELHRGRNRRAIVDTVRRLLHHTRAHAGFALRPAGHQVLANVERICDLARGYELGGGRSFRGFVEQLDEEASKPTSTEAPIVEDGAEGVRLMTVHNAKGLEFPVVILADMNANLASQRPQRTVDVEQGLCAQLLLGCAPVELLEREQQELARDRAEGLRIAYVAATRARDLLVVPAVGDEAREGWLEPLNRAFFPAHATTRRRSEPAPGCPPFGDATVLQRPSAYDGRPELSVRPGLHRFPQLLEAGEPKVIESGGYSVVWWDPRALPSVPDANFGLRQEEILTEDEGGAVAEESLQQYRDWQAEQQAIVERGSEEAFRVQAVTELEEPAPGADARGAPEVVLLEREPGRPAGVRFGTLVHTLLRDAELDASLERLEALARLHGRLLDASDEEIASAARAVERALAHPLLRQLRGRPTGEVLREAPFAVELSGRWVVEGTIDLAFRDADGSWTVVDFKTDADLEERRSHYAMQVDWYRFALETLTEAPTRGVLLAL